MSAQHHNTARKMLEDETKGTSVTAWLLRVETAAHTTRLCRFDVDEFPFHVKQTSHNHFWYYCKLRTHGLGREIINGETWWSQQKISAQRNKGQVQLTRFCDDLQTPDKPSTWLKLLFLFFSCSIFNSSHMNCINSHQRICFSHSTFQTDIK